MVDLRNHIRYETDTLFVFQAALFLLDRSSVMDEEGLYEASLRIEPKVPNWKRLCLKSPQCTDNTLSTVYIHVFCYVTWLLLMDVFPCFFFIRNQMLPNCFRSFTENLPVDFSLCSLGNHIFFQIQSMFLTELKTAYNPSSRCGCLFNWLGSSTSL